MIGAGKSKMRLLLCEAQTRKQIEAVRSVITKTIHQKCLGGVGAGRWDPNSAQGRILGALGLCIVKGKE